MHFLLVSFIGLSMNLSFQDSVLQQSVIKKTTQRGFFEGGRITGNVSYIFGRITDYEKNGDGSLNFSNPVFRYRNALSLNVGIRLFEMVYFRPTFLYNLNRNINATWINSDYAFALERVRWDPNTFSYGYMNYEIKKYSDKGEQFLDNLSRGSFYIRYYNHFPQKWIKKWSFDSSSDLSYSIFIRYAWKYWDNQSQTKGSLLKGKPVIGWNLRYTFFKNIYLEGTAFYYPRKETKLSWDPDFTYGFGYNSYSHMSVGFSYGNYSVNRYPWNEKPIKGYGFLDGNFSILLNYRW